MTGSWIRSGGNVSRTRTRVIRGPWGSAARDRRDDGDVVALLQGGLLALEEADVLLVDVDVDEPPDLAALLDQPLPEPGVLPLEVLDQVHHGVALRLHLARALRHSPQGSGDSDQNWHRRVSLLTGLGFQLRQRPVEGRE